MKGKSMRVSSIGYLTSISAFHINCSITYKSWVGCIRGEKNSTLSVSIAV